MLSTSFPGPQPRFVAWFCAAAGTASHSRVKAVGTSIFTRQQHAFRLGNWGSAGETFSHAGPRGPGGVGPARSTRATGGRNGQPPHGAARRASGAVRAGRRGAHGARAGRRRGGGEPRRAGGAGRGGR